MKAYSHCTHSDWKALPCADYLVAYVKWDIGFRLIAQRQVSMSQIWQQNGVNWTSHQRNEERKSSEAKLNLFPFLKLSPWVAVEESCGRERGFVGKHISVCVSVLVVWWRTMNSRMESHLLFMRKKEKCCFIHGLSSRREWRGRKRKEISFHVAYYFS